MSDQSYVRSVVCQIIRLVCQGVDLLAGLIHDMTHDTIYALSGEEGPKIGERVRARSGGKKEGASWDFPGGPVVKTLPSNARGEGLIPVCGARLSHAFW